MTTNNGPAPALRVCDGCGLVDDHPRHALTGADPDGVTRPSQELIGKVVAGGYPPEVTALAIDQLNEPGLYLHLDCCLERGCPDGTCVRQTAGAEDLRGGDLRDHLMSLKES